MSRLVRSRGTRGGVFVIVLSALLGTALAACNSTTASSWWSGACRATSFCDERPRPGVQFEILCDASLGASCTRETLTRTLDALAAILPNTTNT